MTKVQILKSWDWPDLRRQTPGASYAWQDVHFTDGIDEECDYVLILNNLPADTVVRCSPDHVWALIQEPPVSGYRQWHRGAGGVARVYTQDMSLTGSRYVHSQSALPWHVEKDYDTLKKCSPPEKPRILSWITSNVTYYRGHRERMLFLRRIRKIIDFDLWGKGFTPIDDKWNGLAPYRYSLVVENYSGLHYWTEKLADCLLSWTMPLYYGCTNISEYFPRESFVAINIHDPDCPQIIEETITSDLWLRNRDAIAHARELVLNKHQLFPFVCGEIEKMRMVPQSGCGQFAAQNVCVKALPMPVPSPLERVRRKINNLRKWKYKITRSGESEF